jgi:hypothetical protein
LELLAEKNGVSVFVLSFWISSGCFEFIVVEWLALLVSWKLEFWRGAYHDAFPTPEQHSFVVF